MSLITWVGINHYVDEECLGDFYSSLHEGDVVRMVPEPDNFWDERAIAVYYNYLMRGYISRHETEKVHAMVKYNMELVGRVTDDIDEDINQVKLIVDSVSVPVERSEVYHMLGASVLGVEMNPHIMYEERSYVAIRGDVDYYVRMIKTNDIDSDVIGAAVGRIKNAVGTYLGIWDHSISDVAVMLPRYFDDLLTNVSNISDKIRKEFKPLLKSLRKCTKMQSQIYEDTFNGQIAALDSVYSMGDGFYDAFDKMYGGRTKELKKRLDELDRWLKGLTEDKHCTYDKDFGGFARLIYYFGYRCRDLYMIITHLLLMRHVMGLVYGVSADTSMAKIGGLYDEYRKKKIVVEKKSVVVEMQGGTFVKNQIISKE